MDQTYFVILVSYELLHRIVFLFETVIFLQTYTQYIPLSIYDLQQWMGAPSIYVYDCSCAGLVVDSFKQFATQHEREFEVSKKRIIPS